MKIGPEVQPAAPHPPTCHTEAVRETLNAMSPDTVRSERGCDHQLNRGWTMKLRADWAALAISFVAAGFTALQWYEAREQRELQTTASLSFDIDTQQSKHHNGIGVRNAGPGVAHFQSIEYYFDGRAVRDISETLSAMGVDPERDEGIDLEKGDFLAPGEAVWLIDYRSNNKADESHLADLFENRMQVAITYCTASGRCSRICSETVGCPVQRAP